MIMNSYGNPPPAFWGNSVAHRRAIVDYLIPVVERMVPKWVNAGVLATLSVSQNEGRIIYNTSTKKFQYSDGTQWVDL